MAGYRAVVVVIAVALVVAAAVSAIFSASVDDIADAEDVMVGRREVARIASGDGTTVEGTATIDTGAGRSSIGEDVATELGLDLSSAETITVQSALGEEERPVVPVGIQLGGITRGIAVSVNDRSDLTDSILIGRDMLDGFLVSVGQTNLTTPGAPRAPNALQSLLAARASSVSPGPLLALMPLAAFIVVILRYVVGLSTLGTFTPVLLTLGFLQAGILPALVLTAGVVALGVAIEPLLRRWRTPRVARLAILIGLAATVLLGIQSIFNLQGAASSWGAAFPLVVSAGLVERIYEIWQSDGLRDAMADTGWTLLVAAAVTPLLLAEPVRLLADRAPWALALGSLILAAVAGSYRGLRLTELVRFQRTAHAG